MSKNANRTTWVVMLGLIAALATTSLHAAQKKDGKDKEAEAEAKQSAQEDADEAADRAKGIKQKDRRTFVGRFMAIPDAGDAKAADVVGQFTTSNADKKPGRTYLVKVEDGNKNTLKLLMRYDGKNAQLLGKLRVLDADGEGKYLIVNQVVEAAPTPPNEERRKPGGI